MGPDGFFLDILGPYFSDGRNSDAHVLVAEHEAENSRLANFLNGEAVIIADRGYRDAVPQLQREGVEVLIPPSRGRNHQLSTYEANQARLIAIIRWVVEARNAHMKEKFSWLNHRFHMQHCKRIGALWRIGAAIYNAYYPGLQLQESSIERANVIRELSVQDFNPWYDRVTAPEYVRHRVGWIPMEDFPLPLFPRLFEDEIKSLTMGTFQVRLAPGYTQDSLAGRNGRRFHLLDDGDGILRAHVLSWLADKNHNADLLEYDVNCSTDLNGRTYDVWIEWAIRDPANDHDLGIRKWYCICATGARTLGMCSHIARVIWFMSFGRHNENQRYPSVEVCRTISDCAGRYQDENVVEQLIEEEVIEVD